MLLEFLWNIIFSINWHKFFGITKGVAWGNLITVLSLFPLPFETLHMKSMITFFHCFYVYASCLPLDKSCDSEPVSNILKECVWGEARMWWAAKLPRLLESILGSLTEFTAGEQLCPCTASLVSSDQNKERIQRGRGRKSHKSSLFHSLNQQQVGRAAALLRYSLPCSTRTKSLSWAELITWLSMGN